MKVVVAITSPIAFQTLTNTTILDTAFDVARSFSKESGISTHLAIAVADPKLVKDFECEILHCDPNNPITLAAAIKNSKPCELVVIHDSLRPLTPITQFEAVLAALTDQIDAVRAVSPFTESLKSIDSAGNIGKTIDRTSMMRISTPEIIRFSAIDFQISSSTWFVPLKTQARISTIAADPQSIRINSLAEITLAKVLAQSV